MTAMALWHVSSIDFGATVILNTYGDSRPSSFNVLTFGAIGSLVGYDAANACKFGFLVFIDSYNS